MTVLACLRLPLTHSLFIILFPDTSLAPVSALSPSSICHRSRTVTLLPPCCCSFAPVHILPGNPSLHCARRVERTMRGATVLGVPGIKACGPHSQGSPRRCLLPIPRLASTARHPFRRSICTAGLPRTTAQQRRHWPLSCFSPAPRLASRHHTLMRLLRQQPQRLRRPRSPPLTQQQAVVFVRE